MRDPEMTRTFCARLLPFVTALSACSGAGPEHVVAVGDRIRHDDFDYSVRKVERAERIGPRAAAGLFYIVTFQVENRARRVDHAWNDAIAYLVDEHGRTFESDPAGGRAEHRSTTGPVRHVTPAGTTETVLVFDVPKGSARGLSQGAAAR
jgi:hypothetical protein